MRPGPENFSQRLLRKGAFVEETFKLFQNWQPDIAFDQALQDSQEGAFKTTAWSREVSATLKRRFRSLTQDDSLVIAAKSGIPLDEWRSCLLLWISCNEQPYHDFAMEWLYPEFVAGRLLVRTADVCPLVRNLPSQFPNNRGDWSEYGVVRTARDLLRMATDFRLLEARGAVRQFAHFHLSDRCFLYVAHVIAEREGTPSKVPTSKLWRLVLMSPADVEGELLRLHQYQKVHYQAAGSLVQLTLPHESAGDYAVRMGDLA